MSFLEYFQNREIIANLAASLLLIGVVVALRIFSIRLVRSREWSSEEDRLRWHVRIGWSALLALLLGLFAVWAPELQTLALSTFAIAAAVVLATKEIIMCLSGTVLRAVSKSYTVGDRIEIGGIRGDVVNFGLMTTTVLETGPAHQKTGRAIHFPNSLLLSSAVINETFTDEYVLHTLRVRLGAEDDWRAAEQLLLESAVRICSRYQVEAQLHMERVAAEHGLSTPSVLPRVSIQIPEPDKIDLLLRIPTPAREKGRAEQAILRRFLERRGEAPKSPEGGDAPAG